MSTVDPRPQDLGVPHRVNERVVAKGSILIIDPYSDNTNPRRASGFFRKLEIFPVPPGDWKLLAEAADYSTPISSSSGKISEKILGTSIGPDAVALTGPEPPASIRGSPNQSCTSTVRSENA